MTFPVSPTNGQTAVINGITYQYTSASTSWRRVTGTFTATTNLRISDNTNATSTITGALQVVGGAGIGRDMWVGGTIYQGGFAVSTSSGGSFNGGTISSALIINNNTQATSTNSGALQVVNGGAGIGGNLYVGGNTILGTTLNFTPANANLQYGGNRAGYLQVAIQNADSGTTSTTDFVAFTNNGNDNGGYIDFGITSSAYADPLYDLSGPGDGYLYVVGTGTNVGKLTISTYQPQDIIFSTGGGDTAHEIGRWKHTQGLVINSGTNATSTTTGALVVTGGIGTRGDVWGRNIYANDFYYSATSARQPKITVGTTAPTSPAVNDIWVDTN